jgi:hypothetical protein
MRLKEINLIIYNFKLNGPNFQKAFHCLLAIIILTHSSLVYSVSASAPEEITADL